MHDLRHSSYYPAVHNHIIDDPTPKDQAIYVPSVTPGYAMDVFAQKWARPLPNGINASDPLYQFHRHADVKAKPLLDRDLDGVIYGG